jgi:hypothetical protein
MEWSNRTALEGASMIKQMGYLSYLLRMWQTSDGEECTWCASLQQPGTEKRQGFASLDDLFDFLRAKAASQPEASRVEEER